MDLFASIDVGSNSVRLQVAAFISGFQHQVVCEERAVTRLGESVFREGMLSERAMEETASVLKGFRNKAEAYSVVRLRAVGTSALREGQNATRFLKTVKRRCGIDLEVISGREEARLIYLGVISRLPDPNLPLLLIDVGGGSAEFTLAAERRIRVCTSTPLGAVRLTELFLDSDPPAASELERLEGYVRKKLQRAKSTLAASSLLPEPVGTGVPARPDGQEPGPAGPGCPPQHPIRAIGTSGTMAALARAVNRIEGSPAGLDGEVIGVGEAEALYRRLRGLNLSRRRGTPGIGPRRAEIIVAGAAVVVQAMRELGIAEITYSDAGLRDGVLVEMAARHHKDAAGVQYLTAERLETVRGLGERFAYAPSHAAQVALLARQLFRLLQPLHELPESYGELLEAAALLHDIGDYVNIAKSHKHSYYLIANSELPGYSDRERMLIACIARYHRGSWPAAGHEGYGSLPPREQGAMERLAALLRLADACDNGRRGAVQSVLATAKSDRVELTLLAGGPAELETWAAQKAAAFFRKVFGRKLQIDVQTMKSAMR